MKRAAMKPRKAPMRRTGFVRTTYPPAPSMPRATPFVRQVHTPISAVIRHVLPALCKARPKDDPIRSDVYRRLVAAMPCSRCGIRGYSQAAHGDQGKGMGIKSSDTTCYPACGPHDGLPGCHHDIGTGAKYDKQERRELEAKYTADTQRKLILEAQWNPVLSAVLRTIGLVK